MSAADRLSSFKTVDISTEDKGLDTTFADEFLRVFSRMAKAQVKTQHVVSLSMDDTKKALEAHASLVEEVKEERRKTERENERLVRFILEVIDIIFDFRKAAKEARNTELQAVAETMEQALKPNMEKVGLHLIPALGEIPDALYHFVLNTRSAENRHNRDRIVEVVREGFSLNGNVVRKADVIVAK